MYFFATVFTNPACDMCVPACECMCTCVRTCSCLQVCKYVYARVCIRVYVNARVYVYARVWDGRVSVFTNPVCDQSHLSSLLLDVYTRLSNTLANGVSHLDKSGTKLHWVQGNTSSGVISSTACISAPHTAQWNKISARDEWSKALVGLGGRDGMHLLQISQMQSQRTVGDFRKYGFQDCRIAWGLVGVHSTGVTRSQYNAFYR